jgi:predicted dehydrogenase
LSIGGKLAAGSALAGIAIPHVHAAEDNTIRLALIGCGGRGSGAAVNAFEAPGGPVKLVAMADLFADRLSGSYKVLSEQYAAHVDVPPERRFVGFDAYRKAIDCLRPGDIALCCTYPAFRVLHLDYAVEKGVHVFMEKSFAVDPVAARRVIKAGEAAKKKDLKIAAGLMCRHSKNRQELIQRIRDGAMGEIHLIRATRMEGIGPMGQKGPDENEVLWQIRNSIRIFWVSGGLFSEMTIHQIDEVCWLKDAWPVSAHGIGGRAPNSTDPAQNFDSYAIEYTFADGAKATVVARYIPQCHAQFDTFVHGTKCAAQFSGSIHASTVHTYKDQRIAPGNIDWKADKEQCSVWQAEWNVLLDAIRNDRPHNEAERAAMSNLAAIMGRAAVHSGKIITWEEVMASKFQYCKDIDGLSEQSPPPVQADAQGRYPSPVPGVWAEI